MGAILLLFQQLPIVGIWNFGMWGVYNLAKTDSRLVKSSVNRWVNSWLNPCDTTFKSPQHIMIRGRLETGASIGLTKETTRLFHGPWHDHVSKYIGIGICVESFGLGNSLRNYRFYVSLTNISKRKSDANKQNFERMLNLTWKVRVNQHQKQWGP